MKKPEIMDEEETHERPTLEQAIVALQAGSEPSVDEAILYGLCDLSEEQADMLKPVWNQLDSQYRQLVLQILVDEMESNFELNYDQLATIALADRSEAVRRIAVELLVVTEDLMHVDTLVGVVRHDRAHDVRVAALHGISELLADGVYEDLPAARAERIRTYAQSLWNNLQEHADLRGAALEVLATTDLDVSAAILDAYHSNDESLRVSALAAMRHTADSEQWHDIVMDELANGSAAAQREAARAAGSLELGEALPLLLALMEDSEADAKEIVIWSLGEIGGREALRVLNALAESAEEDEDDDLINLIEDALANATMIDGKDFTHFDLTQ